MKKTSLGLLFTLLFLSLTQCKKEYNAVEKVEDVAKKIETPSSPDIKFALQYFQPLPENFENSSNPLSDKKIYLGKVLYYDSQLSKTGNNSCNSCHLLSSFGVDNIPTSKGDSGGFGNRNAPTVLNAAMHIAQFWDGRAKDVEEQAGGPILNPIEMAMTSKEEVVNKLKNIDYYQRLFSEAFPDSKNPITYDNIQKAIGAFERTMVTESRFDKFMKGDSNSLSENEIKGMKTFVSIGCITCHSGQGLGGNMFQKFGIHHDYQEYTKSKKIDEGLKELTGKNTDLFIFKVPSLRNVDKTYPYFHDGSVKELNEAVKIMAKVQLDKDLSDTEVSEISTFLKSLTGEVNPYAKEIPKEAKLVKN